MDTLTFGFATLAGLTALAALASVAVGYRCYPESRAEAGLAAAVVLVALIHAPIHALGWAHALDAGHLAALSVATSSAVLVAASLRGPGRARALWAACAGLAKIPFDAVCEAWRDRSIILIAPIACGGVALWTAWLSWLAPSSSWDGLWYHEPMVGWAIQNHGFALVDVPASFAWVNGYPRTCENLMLWTTIFADRRLIEVWPSVMAPVAMLAYFVIAMRFTRWRVGAMGLAAVLVLLPGTVLQMRSTYVDVMVLVAYLASLHYVTRPQFRAREVWLAALAIAFLCGAKATGMFYGGMFVLVAAARVAAMLWRRRSGWPVVHAVGGLLVVLALAAPSYARNVAQHGNPIWPLRLEEAGVVILEGPSDLQHMQKPAGAVLHELFGPPEPGQDYHDTRKHAYGVAVPYLALPVGLLALLFALWELGGAWVAHRFRRAREVAAMLFVVALGLVTLATSPAYYWARYSLPAVGAWLVLVGWFLGRRRWIGFGQGLVSAMLVLSCITLYWAKPGWDVTAAEALRLAAMTPRERVGAKPSYSVFPAAAAFAREREIGPGDRVVFADRVAFVGNLWNERMSNRVSWIPYRNREQYLAALGESGAKWVIARVPTPEERALRSAPGRWERLFEATRHDDVYRRVAPGSEAPAHRDAPRAPRAHRPAHRELLRPDRISGSADQPDE